MSATLLSCALPGHDISSICNDTEYGGRQAACSCGWRGPVHGVSDPFQFQNILREGRRHEDESWRLGANLRMRTCKCGHEEEVRDCDEIDHVCTYCLRRGTLLPR